MKSLANIVLTSVTIKALAPEDTVSDWETGPDDFIDPKKLIEVTKPGLKLISPVEGAHGVCSKACHLCGDRQSKNCCPGCYARGLEREIKRCRDILESTYKGCSLDLDSTFILCYCYKCTSNKLTFFEVNLKMHRKDT